MATFRMNTSWDQVEQSTPLIPLPAGWYPAVCTKADLEHNRQRTGRFIEAEYEIIDGPFRGRKVYNRLNVENPSPKATEIALGAMKAWCLAMGIPPSNDTAMLTGKPFALRVSVEPERYDPQTGKTYQARNEIKGGAYMSIQEAQAENLFNSAPPPMQQNQPPQGGGYGNQGQPQSNPQGNGGYALQQGNQGNQGNQGQPPQQHPQQPQQNQRPFGDGYGNQGQPQQHNQQPSQGNGGYAGQPQNGGGGAQGGSTYTWDQN